MKWFFLLFLMVNAVFLPEARSQQTAWIHLTADQLPVSIQIDSTQLPPTRDTLITVAPGKHTIKAIAPYRADWLLRDFQTSLSVSDFDTASVTISFTRYLILASQPEEAFVWVSDSLIGRTPHLIKWSAIKDRPVRIEKTGYHPKQFIVKNLNQKMIAIQLKKDAAYWKKFHWLQHRKQIQEKHLFWGAIATGGSALASGIGAYLLKKRANKSYDRYLKTPFPGEIKKYYNQAHRYDTYAGTSYLIFEVNIIASAILLLKAMGK